jgi:phosphohistidine phosphatase SixA
MMRHALAPGGGDPANFDVNDCTTQRNLDERGREQARRIGAALRERGIAFDRVLSSHWCRCIDTAREMALGPVEAYQPLDSFFRNRSEGPAQTEALRDFLATLPDDTRPMLVTHQVNVTALTDVFPSSGEIVVIDMMPDGTVDVLGTILVDP